MPFWPRIGTDLGKNTTNWFTEFTTFAEYTVGVPCPGSLRSAKMVKTAWQGKGKIKVTLSNLSKSVKP